MSLDPSQPLPVEAVSGTGRDFAVAGGWLERPRLQATPERPKIWLHGVSQAFSTPSGAPLCALSDIELKVAPGEFLCIVGPSGCGKSTLLHLIAGLAAPQSGEIWMDDHRVQGPGTDRILLFQNLGLFPWLTARENVEFGLRVRGVPRKERRERAADYLRRVHLSAFADSYIHELSGGMCQRVALARALATEPDVLLMDEPFAALDAQTRDMLHDELERIWKETSRTIIFVTHNVREAVRLGDRIILLTFRPGCVKREYSVSLPRPRHLEEDPAVALAARDILHDLREEICRALGDEYGRKTTR